MLSLYSWLQIKNDFIHIDQDKVVDFLLQNRAEVNLRDFENRTPLFVAARNGNFLAEFQN